MKRGTHPKKEISKNNLKNLKKRLLIAMIILIIAIVIYLIYLMIFQAKECKDINCYQQAMADCNKIWFIKKDPSSVWRYEILGNAKGDACNIEVRLLKMREGAIEIEDLQDKKMICKIQKSSTAFPEKDMSQCTGVLREELQEILIQRMHNYLLENIGELQESFEEV